MTVAQDQGHIRKPPKSPLLRLDSLLTPQLLQAQLQRPGIEVGLATAEGVLKVAGVAQQPRFLEGDTRNHLMFNPGDIYGKMDETWPVHQEN